MADIRIEGIKQVDPQLLLNQIRIRKGDPYAHRIVEQDLVRLRHLNKFSKIEARVEPLDDGSVVLTYVVDEHQLITNVQVVGNRALPDQQLLALVGLRTGDPVDSFLISRGRKRIVESYEEAGYFDTSVRIDQKLLEETGILLFRVVEGPTVRIRAFRFAGNKAFSDKQLQSKIRSRPYIPLFRKGELSRQRTLEDAALIRQFYRDRGYLEADVVREIQRSPDGRDAIVIFTIVESGQYIVENIVVQGNEVFSTPAVVEAISLRVGDVYSVNRLEKSERDLNDMYARLGYLEARIRAFPVFLDDKPNRVEVLITIREGKPYWVGTITIKGNALTQQRVIERQIRGLYPGRRYDGTGIAQTQKRLNRSALFDKASLSILGDPEDEFRPLLIEVQEANTGSLGFGAGISSDAGLIGALNLRQRNFDLLDFPESVGEFFTGKAFRGAGQLMSINFQPGNKTSRYSINFREPYLLDSNVFLDTSGFFFESERRDFDEERLGGAVGFGQHFGEVYSASVRVRVENIDLTHIDADAPMDVFAVSGRSDLTSLGVSLTRSTVDDGLFPTRGSRLTGTLGRAGALGGDYDFTRLSARYRKFWTVDEDFFGRRTVLSARIQGGYILEDDEAPVFERFYAGGHRSFRGFAFRGVGPRGLRADTGVKDDDPVGGDWIFLFGVEYNFPIYEETIRFVVFLDTGTVQDDIGFDEYRASIGGGVRLKVPFLGQAPFALDLAVPIAKEPGDETQPFSFNLAIPF